MIKIRCATVLNDHCIRLEFSDGSQGDFDCRELIARDTEMVKPLSDPAFFSQCFLELGALCWRNGFALSAGSLQQKLAQQGQLRYAAAA